MVKTFFAGMTFLVALLGMTGSAWAVEIAGIVVDEAGKPVADATVAVQGDDLRVFGILSLGQTNSGIAGEFRLALPPMEDGLGLCQIVATHPDYGISIPYVFDQEKEPLSRFRIVVTKRGFIQGKVVDTTGKPVVNAEIKVFFKKDIGWAISQAMADPPHFAQSLLYAKTDTDGAFKLEGLPQGIGVTVCGSYPGYITGVVGASAKSREPNGTIMVGSTNILITLHSGSTIEGRVITEETGSPIAHVIVHAIPVGSTERDRDNRFDVIAPAETDDKGAYVLHNLDLGKYRISVTLFRGVSGGGISREAEIIQIGRLKDLDFTVTKWVRISGKFIKEDTEEPVCGGELIFSSMQREPYTSGYSCLSKSDGTFEAYMPPGDALVSAYDENHHVQEQKKPPR